MSWPTAIPRTAIFYKSLLGEWLVLNDPSGFGQPNYHSPDGVNFFQLHQNVYGAGDFRFESPVECLAGKVIFDGQRPRMEVEGKSDRPEFTISSSIPQNITVIPLPPTRELLHFFRLRNGEYLLVSNDKYDNSRELVRLYYGRLEHMNRKAFKICVFGNKYEIDNLGVFEYNQGYWRLGGYVLDSVDKTRFTFVENEDYARGDILPPQ